MNHQGHLFVLLRRTVRGSNGRVAVSNTGRGGCSRKMVASRRRAIGSRVSSLGEQYRFICNRCAPGPGEEISDLRLQWTRRWRARRGVLELGTDGMRIGASGPNERELQVACTGGDIFRRHEWFVCLLGFYCLLAVSLTSCTLPFRFLISLM